MNLKTSALVLFTLCTGTAYPQVPRIVLPDLDRTEPLTDPEKLAERIVKTSKAAGEKLAEDKANASTLRDQNQVKKDLDALIKLLEPPPQSSQSSGGSSSQPPPPGSPPPPSGGSKPKPKDNDPGQPPPKPKDKAGEHQPMPKPGEPKEPKDAQPMAGAMPGQAGSAPTLPVLPPEESLARDFWGHLPDTQRQQMMQFYREQYMTKYKDLLSQYYQSLAEKDRRK